MPINVIFPKVSLEMATGSISRWLVDEGDAVTEGQVLFEIDNDKAAVEVESPGAGVIRLMIAPGVEIDVGAEVASVFAADELAGAATSSPARTLETAATAPITSGVRAEARPSRRNVPNPTPLARRLAREHGLSLEDIAGTGPRGRVQKVDVLAGLSAKSAVEPKVLQTSLQLSSSMKTAQTAPLAPSGSSLLNAVWLRQGAGMPVVMLHGFSGDLNNWGRLLAGGRSDFPALGIDLPAHGRSPSYIPADLDEVAELVEETVRALEIGPCVLAGHSFGGAVSIRIARRARLDVRALCLFAPAGLGPEINHAFTQGILRGRSPESLRPWLEQLVHDPANISEALMRIVAQQRRDDRLTQAMADFANRFFPDGTQSFSVAADLARISQTVRMIFGRQDRILPFSTTRGLPDNVALHALDSCGHMPHVEKPELALRILNEVWRAA